jgi:hypothetical protein
MEKKKVKFTDFSALWEEEWGRGRMSWGGKGDWVVIGTILGFLLVTMYLDCTDRVNLPQPWIKYYLVIAGLIWLAGGVVRFLVPQWRRPLPGLFMPGYAFCTLGIMLIFGWKMWPVIALAVALFIAENIIYGHFRKKMLERDQ